jgi:two-component system chemotaxis response regulator CheB
MPDARVVVIGTSAGRLDALRTIAANLPPNFPAPIAIVMHTGASSPGVLAESSPAPARCRRSRSPLSNP